MHTQLEGRDVRVCAPAPCPLAVCFSWRGARVHAAAELSPCQARHEAQARARRLVLSTSGAQQGPVLGASGGAGAPEEPGLVLCSAAPCPRDAAPVPARCLPGPGEQQLGAGVLGARRSQRRLSLGDAECAAAALGGSQQLLLPWHSPCMALNWGGGCPPGDAGCWWAMLSSPRAQIAQQMGRGSISSPLGC